MASINSVCAGALNSIADAESMLRMINAQSQRVNNLIGQVNSLVSGQAYQQYLSKSFAFSGNIGSELRSQFSSCSQLADLLACLNSLENELSYGKELGLPFDVSGPCLQAFLSDLIDIEFQCLSKTTEAYIDSIGGDPQVAIRNDLLNPPTISPVDNLEYERQDADILLTWDDPNNDPDITAYEVKIYGIVRNVTFDKTILIKGLTPLRPITVEVTAIDRTLRFRSNPVSVTVIVEDGRTPFDPTGVTLIGVGSLEALLEWVRSTFPNVIGYNIRWSDGPGLPEKIYSVGDRSRITLRDLFTSTTVIRITTLTEWDESDGVTVTISPATFAETNSSFDLGTYNPGDSGTLTLEFNQNLAALGPWYVGALKNGTPSEDIVILDTDMALSAVNEIEVDFTIPGIVPPGGNYNLIEVRVYNALGESLLIQKAIP